MAAGRRNIIQGFFGAALFLTAISCFGEETCKDPSLTKTDILIKVFEALKQRGIGLVSFQNMHIRIENAFCGYQVFIRSDPPTPSGLISVEIARNGAIRKINTE